MKNFEDLNIDELWMIRNEITINSLFIADYNNSFGFNPKDISTFFDGYFDYICELCEEKESELTLTNVLNNFDNKENLLSWFNCFDDLTWIKLERD